MRWAREVWVHAHFDRLCRQFHVETAVDLSCVLRACMEKNDSIVYVGFSFKAKRPYYGLVHNRKPQERRQEHWRAMPQHSSGMEIEREQKYSYMSHNGGAAKWYFLPYNVITCGPVIDMIPILKLNTLETGSSRNSLTLWIAWHSPGHCTYLCRMAKGVCMCMTREEVTWLQGEISITVWRLQFLLVMLMVADINDTI